MMAVLAVGWCSKVLYDFVLTTSIFVARDGLVQHCILSLIVRHNGDN